MNPLDWLFPPKCPVCGELLEKKDKRICSSCRKILPRVVEPCCLRCGKPLQKMEQEYCRDCGRKRQRTERDPVCQGTSLWIYNTSMKKAMAAFKYEGCRQDGLFFGDELVRFRGSRIRSYHPDYVIPVPLHRRKLWFRGYNQAACVAERLGERMGIPVLPDALRRVRYTKPQKGMNDKERRDNVEGAFQVRKRFGEQLRGARILLVDDIYTTGATVDACAGALRDEGTGEIFFACLCTGNDE